MQNLLACTTTTRFFSIRCRYRDFVWMNMFFSFKCLRRVFLAFAKIKYRGKKRFVLIFLFVRIHKVGPISLFFLLFSLNEIYLPRSNPSKMYAGHCNANNDQTEVETKLFKQRHATHIHVHYDAPWYYQNIQFIDKYIEWLRRLWIGDQFEYSDEKVRSKTLDTLKIELSRGFEISKRRRRELEWEKRQKISDEQKGNGFHVLKARSIIQYRSISSIAMC